MTCSASSSVFSTHRAVYAGLYGSSTEAARDRVDHADQTFTGDQIGLFAGGGEILR